MQSLAKKRDDVELTPLWVVLERVGAELCTLAAEVDRLQDVFGPALMQAAEEKPHMTADIQGLDSIAQTLAGLSDFVAALGRGGPTGSVAVLPLADRLTLSALADRLRGDAGGATDDEFELF